MKRSGSIFRRIRPPHPLPLAPSPNYLEKSSKKSEDTQLNLVESAHSSGRSFSKVDKEFCKHWSSPFIPPPPVKTKYKNHSLKSLMFLRDQQYTTKNIFCMVFSRQRLSISCWYAVVSSCRYAVVSSCQCAVESSCQRALVDSFQLA